MGYSWNQIIGKSITDSNLVVISTGTNEVIGLHFKSNNLIAE